MQTGANEGAAGLSTDVGRFRLVSLLEGVSYVLLLGVAMPLKYLAGDPRWVRLLGSAHGLLFVIFVVALGRVVFTRAWPVTRAGLAFVASFVPFGAFAFEAWLRRSDPPA